MGELGRSGWEGGGVLVVVRGGLRVGWVSWSGIGLDVEWVVGG